jgi:Tfp pilus assembly protein PilN
MKAVNLIPTDARRVGKGGAPLPSSPSYLLLGLLALAVALVTVYVLTNNKISDRQAQLTTVKAQVAQAQARATGLADYQKFAKLAEARAQTVRQIAGTRFDWYGALSDLSKVVPADTSLQSLFGSVAPGASTGGSSGSGNSSSLRGDLSAPAFELTGCTKTQDDVARLMSRLRLISGVTRVTLGDSQKQGAAGAGASASSAGTTGTGATAGQSGGCGPNAPTFDLVVFFQPLPGAPATASAATGSSAPASPAAAPAAAANRAASSSSGTSSSATTSSSSPGAATPTSSGGTP